MVASCVHSHLSGWSFRKAAVGCVGAMIYPDLCSPPVTPTVTSPTTSPAPSHIFGRRRWERIAKTEGVSGLVGQAAAPTASLSIDLARQYDRFLRQRLAQREISKRSYGLYLTPVRQRSLYLLAKGLPEENSLADI